jgi:hypothetical protein
MFRALMTVQWKWTKAVALLATLLGFAVPIASVQAVRFLEDDWVPVAASVVSTMQRFGVAYALLAGGVGLAFALLAWSHDHRGRHVYALSLPISRARYAGMRFAAGLCFLLLPTIGVLVGSVVAVLIAPIPPGLHGYPVALTLRFFLACCVAFSIFFAISSSTAKAAGIVLGSLAALLLIAFILSAASVSYDLLGHTATFFFAVPGVLSIFTGRWMLVDV